MIGDTPRDIACAWADGVRCVAVTTGQYGPDELADGGRGGARCGRAAAPAGGAGRVVRLDEPRARCAACLRIFGLVPVWLRARSGGLIAIVLMVAAFGLLGPRPSDAVAHRVARDGGAAPQKTPPTLVTVDPRATGNRIAAGFLGLSFEYWAAANYAGKNPNAVDPVLVQLIRNLMPDGGGSLRIGGVTTDWTWWPVHGVAQPGGVNYTLTTSRLRSVGRPRSRCGGSSDPRTQPRGG